MKRVTVVDLQILRGIAVLFVLLHHLSITSVTLSKFPKQPSMPFWFGVEIFFVLSGYLIFKVGVIYPKEISTLRFFLHRVFRIYPNLVFFFLVSGIMNFMLLNFPISEWGKNNLAVDWEHYRYELLRILFLSPEVTQQRIYQNTVLWSLVVELHFYLIIGLLLGSTFFLKRKVRENLLKVLVLGVTFFLLCVRLGANFDLNANTQISYLISNKFDFLFAGAALAAIHTKSSRIKKFSLTPMLLAIILLLISWSEPIYPANAGNVLNYNVLPLCLILVLTIVYWSAQNLAFDHEWRPNLFLKHLGDISYSVFLFQFPVFTLFWILVDLLYPKLFFVGAGVGYVLGQVVFCLPIILKLSQWAHRNIELRFIALSRKLYK